MNGLTGIPLQPPFEKGFLLAKKSLVVALWNGFMVAALLVSSGTRNIASDIGIEG